MQTNVEFHVNWDNGITDVVSNIKDARTLARLAPMGRTVLHITKFWTDSNGVHKSKTINP